MELRDSTDSLIFEKREKLTISFVSSWEKLMSNVEIKEDGNLKVYIDNSSSDKVYFDNFEIERTEATVAVVVQENHYYPFGMNMKGIEELDLQSIEGDDEHRFQYNGKEKEESFGLYWNDYGWRNYDMQLGRWHGVDKLAEKYQSLSSYTYVANNPLKFIDPDGQQIDWVSNNSNEIYWDDNANSQETTKEGETYLGKELEFVFNSYIDASLWDGPGGDTPAGDKLTSTVTLTASENSNGKLTGVSSKKDVKIGETPIGTGRDYFPDLNDSQNKFTSNQSNNENGTLSNYSLNFEQHASVSFIEELGLNIMGYDIVNVAQRLSINISDGKLSIVASTDIFPSATLSVNEIQLFRYDQPSFEKTHGRDKVTVRDDFRGGVGVETTTTPRRPKPRYYLRYEN